MAWEQDLPPPILIWLVRELLRLRRREGPQLRQPLGVIVKDCGGQLLETHRRQGARDLEKWQQGKGKKKGKSSPGLGRRGGGRTYVQDQDEYLDPFSKQARAEVAAAHAWWKRDALAPPRVASPAPARLDPPERVDSHW